MNLILFCLVTVFVVDVHENNAEQCGCKTLRPCYKKMLDTLLDRDEAACIEDAAIGASTVTIFLKAIQQFCGSIMNVSSEHLTYEGRHLYEVVLSNELLLPTSETTTTSRQFSRQSNWKEKKDEAPVIIIEAGQEGGTESVGLALYLVEQLVACEEYDSMLQRVTWVILPCTNPDGQEYSRYSQVPWKKNLKPAEDQLSFGVDLTRNFESMWSSCDSVESGFSPIYPGPSPASENETQFIKSILTKYKKNSNVYISIKRDGHSIHYPYGYQEEAHQNVELLRKVAGEVASRVNQRIGGLHVFENMSLFDAEGRKHCGNSIDFAIDSNIRLCYEMRVFLGSDSKIMSKFQQMPPGYVTLLRKGYFSGIREIYNIVSKKKYGKI